MIPAFTSCKNEANEAEENTAAETAVHNCYQYVSKSDTIKMDITIEDNHVSGSLVYNFYEKDKNCLLYTSPSPRDRTRSRMPSSA